MAEALVRPRHQAEQGMDWSALPRHSAPQGPSPSSFFVVRPMGRAASCERPSQPDSPFIDRPYSSVRVLLPAIRLAVSGMDVLGNNIVSLWAKMRLPFCPPSLPLHSRGLSFPLRPSPSLSFPLLPSPSLFCPPS
ncbi:hypothetical protein PRIPAC_73905, partial [Pristionchus pacificus]|uniref:Uncharacterized protein n=1 Tax=Pristionchus pacificus TaxID=54126 RepID=A0A2A6CZZ9_PRIPA